MEEIHKLRAQVSNIMQMYFPGTNVRFVPKLPPPDKTQVNRFRRDPHKILMILSAQIKVLKQLISAAFIDQVAVRKDLVSRGSPSNGSQYSNSHGVPYRAVGITEDVFLHPSSVLSDLPPPDYFVFQEIIRTTRIFVKGMYSSKSIGKPLDTIHGSRRLNSSQSCLVVRSCNVYPLHLLEAFQKGRWRPYGSTTIRSRRLGTACSESGGASAGLISLSLITILLHIR